MDDVDVVSRYLARIGLDPSKGTVAEIQRAHVTAIPFENIDVLLGRRIRIDFEGVVNKIVDRGRGGYCFEQNGLLAGVLERLGSR